MFRNFLNKHKYIKVFKFSETKNITINYYKIKDYKPFYLINPDHIFYHKGYLSIITSDKSAETINPLDFKSRFSAKDFKVAIESKLIKETFGTLKDSKIDWLKVIMFANLLVSAILLFIILKQGGIL